MSKWTTITLSKELKVTLDELRRELGFVTYIELIKHFISVEEKKKK